MPKFMCHCKSLTGGSLGFFNCNNCAIAGPQEQPRNLLVEFMGVNSGALALGYVRGLRPAARPDVQ